jgi:hypothetical protein
MDDWISVMRNGLVDYGRLLAAAGIIWFHTQAPGSIVGYVAFPLFLVLLALPSRASASVKAQRLLVPFVGWSAIYGLVNIALAVKNNRPPLGWWSPEMLLAGTSIHLWFLPFAFVMALAARNLRHPAAAPLCAILLATIFAMFGTASTAPFAQWCFGVIPVLIGIAYFSGGLRIALPSLLLACTIWYVGRPSPDILLGAGGTILALIVLTRPLAETPASRWCARASKCSYLAHPLVMLSGQTIHLSGLALGLFSVAGSLILSQAIDSLFASRAGLRVRAAF